MVYSICHIGHLLLHPLSTPCVPEAFCKRIVVDLQLGHLLILICCHCYELALLEISHYSAGCLWTYSMKQCVGDLCYEPLSTDGLDYLEDIGPECGVGELKDVTGPHQVKPRLVLVHRVQNRLQQG